MTLTLCHLVSGNLPQALGTGPDPLVNEMVDISGQPYAVEHRKRAVITDRGRYVASSLDAADQCAPSASVSILPRGHVIW